MPNSPPPPTYEEAVLCSADVHHLQNQSVDREYPQHRQGADNSATEPPKLALSSLTSSHPSLTVTQAEITPISCVLELMDAPCESALSAGPDCFAYMNAPAIVIHSALSTPGDDGCDYFNKLYPSRNNSPLNEQQGFHNEQQGFHNDQQGTRNEQQGLHNEQRNKSPYTFSDNIRKAASSAAMTTEIQKIERTHRGTNDAELPYHINTMDQNSVIFNNGESHSNRCIIGPFGGWRKANRINRRYSTSQEHASMNGLNAKSMICISAGGNSHPRFYSHESLIRNPHHYHHHNHQNLAKSREKSNSANEALCRVDRIRAKSVSSTPDIRQRSGTLDGSSVQYTHNFKPASRDRNDATILAPSCSQISKSYNDLSGRHKGSCHRDSYCNRNVYKCPQCHSPSNRECGCIIAKNSYISRNLSSSRVNRSAEENRVSKQHLLPDAGNLHGTRGLRSVSVDDVRMRGGTDDYEWKDGKVQMKNGGMTHGESVRYVWRDGHVEKITSDANNEDTQVEILETSDNKTCSKINPVFVCVFLLAVIALVVIIPVYFSS